MGARMVAFLPRSPEWSGSAPPLNYRSVLRMLVANGAEVQCESDERATHRVRSGDGPLRGGGGGGAGRRLEEVSAGWVHACHRAKRRMRPDTKNR